MLRCIIRVEGRVDPIVDYETSVTLSGRHAFHNPGLTVPGSSGDTATIMATRNSPRLAATILALSLLVGCSGILERFDRPGADHGSQNQATMPVPAAPPERPARVAILLSDDVTAYQAIADEITQRGPHNEYLTVSLAGRAGILPPETDRFRQFDPDKIVAIGLLAATTARELSDRPMVFCQVFNYRDHALLTARSKGVKLLPPFTEQVAIWKDVAPNLRTVGVIVGPNQDDLLAEMRLASARQRTELMSLVVTTDKEALSAFKQLAPQIQGFWLLPDNRILSPRVLREMLSYGNKHGVQIAAFDNRLLNLGADISFMNHTSDVADAALRVLGGAGSKDILFGPPMTSLAMVRATVKSDMYALLRDRGNAPDKLERYSTAD